MTKRTKVYGVLVLVVTAYLGWLCYLYLSDRVSPEHFLELKEGMTKSEVRGVLGWGHDYSGFIIVKGQVHVDLVGCDGTAMLAFDDNDRLIWMAWDETRRLPTLRERYERWQRGEVRE